VSAAIGSTRGRWSSRRGLSRAKPPSREEVGGSVGDRRDAEVGGLGSLAVVKRAQNHALPDLGGLKRMTTAPLALLVLFQAFERIDATIWGLEDGKRSAEPLSTPKLLLLRGVPGTITQGQSPPLELLCR
jgi:hypothetical protein